MLNEEVLCMFRRWLCLALALVVSMGAFSLAEEIALEDGAVTVDAPEDALLCAGYDASIRFILEPLGISDWQAVFSSASRT